MSSVAASPPRLYRHALESIFVFASLTDLHSLMAVCREWCEAVMTMAPVNAPVVIRGRVRFNSVLSGSLRRHVSELRKSGPVSLQFNCNCDELEQVSLALPWMRAVRAHLHQLAGSDRVCSALSRFTALRQLQLFLGVPGTEEHIGSVYNSVIKVIGGLTSIDALELTVPNVSAGISFAPLRSLQQLRVLELVWYECEDEADVYSQILPLTDQQIEDLCAIPSLEELLLPFWTLAPSEVKRLYPPGSIRRWTKLSAFQANAANISCFAALPMLTSLDVTWHTADCSALMQLSHLTDLSFGVNVATTLSADNITDAIKTCTRLTKLKLVAVSLTSSHLAALLPQLPLLSTLTLRGLMQLESLRCFANDALAASLTSLSLGSLSLCPSAEVEHLLGLRSLNRLTVPSRVFRTPIRDELKALFVRGDRFPMLEKANFA